MDKQAKRTGWIDCVRGIAIVLVVLGHLDIGNNPLCKWISSFHVPLFFVLSGVLVSMRDAYREKKLGSLLLYKTRQYLYPYLTFSLLPILYNLLTGSPAQALKLTLTLEGYNTLWFLPTLWLAECLLLILLRSRIPDGLATALLLLGTTLYSALQYYYLGGMPSYEAGALFQLANSLCRAGVGAVFMMAGYKGHRFSQKHASLPKKTRIVGAGAAFLFGFACCWMNGMPDLHFSVLHNPLLYYSAALLQSGGLIVLCANLLPKCRALEFWGRNSIVIMATHYPLPVVAVALRLMKHIGTGMRYLDDLIACAIVMLMETAIILAIHRFAPFMLRLPARKAHRSI